MRELLSSPRPCQPRQPTNQTARQPTSHRVIEPSSRRVLGARRQAIVRHLCAVKTKKTQLSDSGHLVRSHPFPAIFVSICMIFTLNNMFGHRIFQQYRPLLFISPSGHNPRSQCFPTTPTKKTSLIVPPHKHFAFFGIVLKIWQNNKHSMNNMTRRLQVQFYRQLKNGKG